MASGISWHPPSIPIITEVNFNVYLSEVDSDTLEEFKLVSKVNTNAIEIPNLELNKDYWCRVAEVSKYGEIGAYSKAIHFKLEKGYNIYINEDNPYDLSKYKLAGSSTSKKFKLKNLKDNTVYWICIAESINGMIGAFSEPYKIETDSYSSGIYEVLISEMGDTKVENFKVALTTDETNYNKKEGYFKASINGLTSSNKYWVVIREKQDGLIGALSLSNSFFTSNDLGTTTIHISKDNIIFDKVGEVVKSSYFRIKELEADTLYYAYVQVTFYDNLNKKIEAKSDIFTFTTGEEPSPILLVPYDVISYDTHILENSVKISTDNQLVVNQVNLTYYNRRGLYNRNDFLNGYRELEYVKYKTEYDVSQFKLIERTIDEYGNYNYIYNVMKNFHIDDDVNKVSINELVSLVDNETGYEILGKIVDLDVKWKTIDVYLGYEVDRALQVYGKTKYLYENGYGNSRNYTLKVRRTELPIICKYAREIDSNVKTEFLKFPLIPHLDYECYLKFSVPDSSLYNFTNLIEEIDNIYGTFDNTDIVYGNEIHQKIPLYIHSNKLKLAGNSKDTNYITYDSYDNSNLKVKIEIADDNESDLKCTFINTLDKIYDVIEEYPLSTQGTILQVDDITKFNVGDCLMLHKDNMQNPLVKDYYSYNSNNRYTVLSIFNEDGEDYVVLDGVYPKGNENEQLKYIKYDYREVIHLQSFYLRGNPVVEEEEYNLYENTESIEAYGTKSVDITGKIIKREDLSKLVDYYMEGFNGINEKGIKFVFPIEIVGGLYDIKPLDIIEIEDPIYTGLNKQLMLVVSKKVKRAVNGLTNVDRTESYELFPISGVEVFNDKIVKTIQRQDYIETGQIFNINFNENDKIIEFTSKEYGILKVELIEAINYKATVQTSINGDSNSLYIKNIAGQRSTYNSLITAGKRIVIKINNEFILVEGQNVLNNSSTTQLFKIVKRDIFNTGITQIVVNQDILFYKNIN